MDEEQMNESMEDVETPEAEKKQETKLPEAPISINIRAYYKGFSVQFTKRMEGNQLTPHVDGTLALIQKLIDKGFNPSWNEETNKAVNGHSNENAPGVNPDTCSHINVGFYQVKKEGKNQGKWFKSCQ